MTQASSRAPRPRVARGPRRPAYLGNPDLDRVMMMLTALTAEVSAIRERIDTHERMAADGQAPIAAAVDAADLTADAVAERSATREAMLRRVFRVLFEELEEARRDAPAEETTS